MSRIVYSGNQRVRAKEIGDEVKMLNWEICREKNAARILEAVKEEIPTARIKYFPGAFGWPWSYVLYTE